MVPDILGQLAGMGQRCLIFTWPFQPKADLPRGKENVLPMKQPVGFEPGTFGPQPNALKLTNSEVCTTKVVKAYHSQFLRNLVGAPILRQEVYQFHG